MGGYSSKNILVLIREERDAHHDRASNHVVPVSVFLCSMIVSAELIFNARVNEKKFGWVLLGFSWLFFLPHWPFVGQDAE